MWTAKFDAIRKEQAEVHMKHVTVLVDACSAILDMHAEWVAQQFQDRKQEAIVKGKVAWSPLYNPDWDDIGERLSEKYGVEITCVMGEECQFIIDLY